MDPRALSLMRIGIALLVISDLVIRLSDLRAHYSYEGVWPGFLIPDFGWKPGYWSFYLLNESFTYTALLFSLHLVCAVCLLLGFKTRLFTLLVWLFTVSLHNRNLFILQGGDDLLRLTIMWGFFLPWGTCYSIDALLKKSPVSLPYYSGNIGYLLLLASVYFFSANLKTGEEWHETGNAAYFALSLEQLRLPLGDCIYTSPVLLKLATHVVIWSEYAIAPLILIPSVSGVFRLAAFGLLILLHAAIGATLYVGLFFLIGAVSAIGLIPGSCIDRIEKRIKIMRTTLPVPSGKGKTIVFLKSGVCACLIFMCLMINLSTVNWFPYEMRDTLARGANALRLDQFWGMFSPSVMKTDGWYVYHGMDSIGRQWDLRLNQDYVDYTKPRHIVDMYKNDRWRKLAENMQKDSYIFLRPLYCKYRIRTWNAEHPNKKMASLRVYFMQKENLAGYRSTVPVKTLHCMCYDD